MGVGPRNIVQRVVVVDTVAIVQIRLSGQAIQHIPLEAVGLVGRPRTAHPSSSVPHGQGCRRRGFRPWPGRTESDSPRHRCPSGGIDHILSSPRFKGANSWRYFENQNSIACKFIPCSPVQKSMGYSQYDLCDLDGRKAGG